MSRANGIQSIPRRIIDPFRSITRAGGGRSDDLGQEILAERGGAKRLPVSRRNGIRAASAAEPAQLSCSEGSFTKELHLSRGSEAIYGPVTKGVFARVHVFVSV
jgi:hypothetical protein